MFRILFLSLFMLVSACGSTAPKDSLPLAQVKVPTIELGDVVATIALPAGDSAAELAPIIEKFQPGASGMAAAQLPTILAKACGVNLSGADLSKPVSVVVVNPKKYQQPVALLVRVKNLAELEASAKEVAASVVHQNGLALVGPAEVVAATQDFAFATLAQPSTQVVAVGYPGPLSKIYQEELHQGLEQINKEMEGVPSQGVNFPFLFKLYLEAAQSLVDQTEKVSLHFASSADSAEMFFQVHPVAGGNFAAFVNAQEAAEHSLLSKLPASAESKVIFSGRMHGGSAKEAILDFSAQVVASMYSEAIGKQMNGFLQAWYEAFDGRFAMSMSMDLGIESEAKPSMSVQYLMGTDDAAAMREGWRAMFSLLSSAKAPSVMGIKTLVDFKQNVFQTDGVEVDHYHATMELDGVDEGQRAAIEAMGTDNQDMYIATFDEYAVMSMATNGKAKVKDMVAAARKSSASFAPNASLSAALAISKERKESLLMFMNIGALVGNAMPLPFQSVVMAMGKSEGALTMRFAIDI